jgi:hypothetical protein
MPDIAHIRPLDDAAALEWLHRQPGRRTDLPGARPPMGMAATAHHPALESLAKKKASSSHLATDVNLLMSQDLKPSVHESSDCADVRTIDDKQLSRLSVAASSCEHRERAALPGTRAPGRTARTIAATYATTSMQAFVALSATAMT